MEMTGPMDIPVPSAMISYNDSQSIKRALRYAQNGTLRLHVRPREAHFAPLQENGTPMVVDLVILAQKLQEFFGKQHGCIAEDCLIHLNTGRSISHHAYAHWLILHFNL